ncbi:MAG: hypothetical protein AB7T06_09845 [Kofleriaceae bacterium]
MSDFDQTCSQDETSYFTPPAQTPAELEQTVGPQPGPELAYAAPADAAGCGAGAFDHYAEEPIYFASTNDGAGGAPASGNDGAEGGPPSYGPDDAEPILDDDGECVDPSMSDEPELDPDGECVDPSAEPAADPKVKKPHEMTPEEKELDKAEKMKEYATQSDEEKQKRWAKADGKLSEEEWKRIQELPPDQDKKQAMLQAGIDQLDYDDPRRAQLEKIQKDMNGQNSRKGGAYATGTPQTGCGSTVDELLKKDNDPSKPAFPGYIKGGEREIPAPAKPGEPMTPRSGDVYELANPKDSNGHVDIHGHAGTFCVASPDGKTWLTFDGGQQSRDSDRQEIKLVTRNVSVNEKGETIVSGPDLPSGTAADNKGRSVSGTYDYQKMVEKYPALQAPQ